jgi:hypothetical protein
MSELIGRPDARAQVASSVGEVGLGGFHPATETVGDIANVTRGGFTDSMEGETSRAPRFGAPEAPLAGFAPLPEN